MLGPFATASRFTLPFTRCRRYTPPAHRCLQQRRQRQRVTEGTAMAPWNGPNDAVRCRIWQQQRQTSGLARRALAVCSCSTRGSHPSQPDTGAVCPSDDEQDLLIQHRSLSPDGRINVGDTRSANSLGAVECVDHRQKRRRKL